MNFVDILIFFGALMNTACIQNCLCTFCTLWWCTVFLHASHGVYVCAWEPRISCRSKLTCYAHGNSNSEFEYLTLYQFFTKLRTVQCSVRLCDLYETCKNHSSVVHWFIWSFINRSLTHLIIHWFIWSFIDHSLTHLSIHRFIWSFIENYICWVHTYTNLLFVQLYYNMSYKFLHRGEDLSARGCKHGLPYSSSIVTAEVSFRKIISSTKPHNHLVCNCFISFPILVILPSYA